MRRSFSRGRLLMTLLVSCSLTPATLLAQAETGDVTGSVVDASGAKLPGVTITVTNLATSQSRTTVTNAVGQYQVAALQPSRYRVRAELEGFRPVERQEITVNVGATLDIDFTMEVGSFEATVTVTGEAPLIERKKTDVSDVITTQQLETLPSKSRQYLDFALLQPATVENVSTTAQGSGFNIGGSRAKEGAVLVDGFYNMDEGFGLPRQRHSQDSIQEFQVISFGGAAEYGRAIGGIVNAITKSGGNTFSGSAYGYFRNNELNAQDAGERKLGIPKTDFDRQQWGATLGGPLVRDKTFFFAAYERVKEDFGFANSIRPSDAALIGLPAEDVGSLPRFYSLHFALAKLDHHINANHRLQASVTMSKWTELDINTQSALGTRSQQQNLKATDWSFMLKWTGVGSNGRVLHDLKASYFPRYYRVGGVSGAGGPPLVPEGQINVGDQANSSPPRVVIPSVAIFGSGATDAVLDSFPAQVLYSLSVNKGRHRLKFGTDYMFAKANLAFYSRLRAQYNFSSLANFLAGNYSTFSQAFGDPVFDRNHHYISAYAQDSWDANDRLTLNYGLRYDLELHPKHPVTGERLGKDYNNVSPRFGLSYDLSDKGTTFFKFASGIYVDRLYQRLSVWYSDLKDHEAVLAATWRPQDPGAPTYPEVFDTAPANLSRGVINSWVMPDALKTPTSAQVVATLEHALTPNLAVAANVIYTRSWNKEHRWDANLAFDDATQEWFRPDPNYRVLQQYRFDGKGEYLGGVLEINKRGGRVGFNANVTISRAYDSGDSGDNLPNDQRLGIDADWGPTADNPTWRGVLSGWWNIAEAFQVAGIFRARGGMAVTPTAAGLDLNGDGVFGDRTPTFGRNSFRLPSVNSLDLRLSYVQSIGDQARLHFYAEGFNVFNRDSIRTVISNYGPDPSSPAARWLEPSTYFPPREVQLGVRLTF
jgi:outer membrane receptor protein involved in Fe transport